MLYFMPDVNVKTEDCTKINCIAYIIACRFFVETEVNSLHAHAYY